MTRILLEIIALTVEDCLAAESGGADRIELCAAIATGGLTPSLGALIEAKKRMRIPIMAMVRPRAGGFCYSEDDFAVMRRDAALLVEHGADGIVFGVLHSDGTIDVKRCEKMLEIVGSRQTVFHRSFDVTPRPLEALEQLIELGFKRVLTSGQEKTAAQGRELLRQLVDRAAGRIEVMPGGGVRPHNVGGIVEATGCRQVHLTALSARCDSSTSNSPITFGSLPGAPTPSYECVDREAVRRMREMLDGLVESASAENE
ncbi:MAG TPA: copper homeostasis protein CutC [Candidatus Bathyarchaeia archaeon]|nr:copper homeostasis protein CutC [Candidatus Bathyarchaeia archaeon]